MKKLFVTAALVAIGVATIAAGSAGAGAQARKHSPKVVCVKYKHNGSAIKVLRYTPRKCTFVRRGKKPIGANTVDTSKLHWKHWGRSSARAKGKELVNMQGPVPVRVKLYRVRKCGAKRVFTKVRFTFHHRHTNGKLDSCPSGGPYGER